ncbi:MAG: tetratricopeptide repeat protein [Acidobacteriota bacterium]
MIDLSPFLPAHVAALAARGAAPRRVQRYPCAMLIADVTGFTRLTERFQELGREGIERIGSLVGRALGTLTTNAARRGGSIVYFGGDSIFAIFRGRSPTRRAFACAEGILASFRRAPAASSPFGPVKLGVKLVIHHGAAMEIHARGATRRVLVVTGPAVAHVARMESCARTGEIELSRAARAALDREPPVVPPAAPSLLPIAQSAYVPPWLPALLPTFEGRFLHVTIAFFELRGWSPELVVRFFRLLEGELAALGGTLLEVDVSEHGSRWLCVFGIPGAHEDDLDRAARAAIAVRRRFRRLRASVHGGIVANLSVGGPARRNFSIVGDAVNTAARALATARWGEVVVTREAARRLGGIATRSRGRRRVQGKKAPLGIHAISGLRPHRADPRTVARMVGRAAELDRFDDALRRAASGELVAIGVLGDPGIGKSRLFLEASRLRTARRFAVALWRGDPYGSTSNGAVRHLLATALGARAARPPSSRWLAGVASRLGVAPASREVLGHVLGHRPPRWLASAPATIAAQAIFDAIEATLAALAWERPLLLLIDDLQWIDASSRELLERLAASQRLRRVAVAVASQGRDAPAGFSPLHLRPLGRSAIEALLSSWLGSAAPELVDLAFERAEGNPLYTFELVRHLRAIGALEIGSRGIRYHRRRGQEDIPDRLEEIVEARLDRLSPGARRAVEVAAVLGRSFSRSLLRGVAGALASRAISEAEASGVVLGSADDGDLLHFSQSLFRDVAYETLLHARRRALHRRTASVLEKRARTEERFLPSLGHHWESAGAPQRALPPYLAAARKAAHACALAESGALYRSYIRCARASTVERVTARLELSDRVLRVQGRTREARLVVERALREARRLGARSLEGQALKGIGILEFDAGRPESGRRALEASVQIARSLGDRFNEAVALNSLAVTYQQQGHLEKAAELLTRAFAIHRAHGDLRRGAVVLANMGVGLAYQGDLAGARRTYEKALAWHVKVGDRIGQGRVLGNLAATLGTLGQEEQSLERFGQALEIQRSIGNRYSEAFLLSNRGNSLDRLGRTAEARRDIEEALGIFRQLGLRRDEARALMLLASVMLHEGKRARAIAQLHRVAESHRGMGGEHQLMGTSELLAQAYSQSARYRESWRWSAQTLRLSRVVGDRNNLGKALIFRGTLALRFGWTRAARRLFSEAAVVHAESGHALGSCEAWSELASLELDEGRRALSVELVAKAALAAADAPPQIAQHHLVRARVARLGEGDLGTAVDRHLDAAATFATDRHDRSRAIEVACERGHLEIARGRSGAKLVAQAREIAARGSFPYRADALRAISRLARAEAARGRSSPLVLGEVPALLPPRLRRALADGRS